MKKYKHITGEIAEEQVGDYENKKYFNRKFLYIHKDLIELSAEWEEIIEEHYEILSFTHDGTHGVRKEFIVNMKNGKLYCDSQYLTEAHYLRSTCWDIHSVKRISDGEIFTIGDITNYAYIDKFEIRSNEMKVFFLGRQNDNQYINLHGIKHTKKPLFTTEDGVEMFKDDKYFLVGQNYKAIEFEAHESSYLLIQINKIFSTKALAEEYIIMNKPCISINDVLKVYEYELKLKDELKQLVKSKLETKHE